MSARLVQEMVAASDIGTENFPEPAFAPRNVQRLHPRWAIRGNFE